MMSSATYDALNKGLRDLRRKELFTWQPDQVSAVDVKWRSGDGFSLERQGGAKQWKSANQPGLEIKARKVQNLLDELHWLRAVDFVEKDAMPSSAQVEIRLKLKDGQTSELKVADPDQAKKQAIAASSEIEGPVLVASHILSLDPTVCRLACRPFPHPGGSRGHKGDYMENGKWGRKPGLDGREQLGDKGRRGCSQGR